MKIARPAMDPTAFGFAVLGGSFMGTYPVPIKSKAVQAAEVNPLVFQWYKTTWVFAAGLAFLFFRSLFSRQQASFVFSWWGIVSALAWVPAGLCTIIAVPIVGVGMSVAVSAATSATISFLVFWLLLGEKIQSYSCGVDCTYYLAPIWLVFAVVGMVGMIRSTRLSKAAVAVDVHVPDESDVLLAATEAESGHGTETPLETQPALSDAGGNLNSGPAAEATACNADQMQSTHAKDPGHWLRWTGGMLAATGTGILSALQHGLFTFGRWSEEAKSKCGERQPGNRPCPLIVTEQFNESGSWMLSFAIGALVTTVACTFTAVMLTTGTRKALRCQSRLILPGSIAGVCWVVGNFFNVAAVLRGGNALVMAQVVSMQLITSGVWGVLWYREVRGKFAVQWSGFAALTLLAIVLLGHEKEGP
eukprot:SAG31_NODE_239_length_19453_cov_5.539888_5_plen_418_part_00